MMPIKAVIWDLGGVILRTEDSRPRQELADQLDMSRGDLEELVFHSTSGMRAQLGEISVEEHWENLRVILRLSDQEMPAVRQAFWGGDRLDIDLLADIRAMQPHYTVGLLSNAFSDLRRVITNTWKIAPIFDAMVISAEVGVMKPDPRIYHLILERLGVLPKQAVFIDDFQRNVEGAQAVGMYALRFQNRDQTLQELQSILSRID